MATYDVLPVREVDGSLRVECPHRGSTPFSQCQSCELGTVVELKGVTHLVCPSKQPEVRAAMSRVVTVPEDLPIDRLVRTFLDEDVTAAPVVNAAGEVVGLVSRTDLSFDGMSFGRLRDAMLSAWPEGTLNFDALECEDDLYVHELLRDRTVRDVMTRTVVWVSPDATVAAAAEMMTKTGLHHLPVLEAHRPVGMLSSDELARWLATPHP